MSQGRQSSAGEEVGLFQTATQGESHIESRKGESKLDDNESEGQFGVTRETWCQMYLNGSSGLGKQWGGEVPPKRVRWWKGCGHGLQSTEMVNGEVKGSCSSVVNRGGFRTLSSPLLGLTWSPTSSTKNLQGSVLLPKREPSGEVGLSLEPGHLPGWHGVCCPHPTARPCFLVSRNDHSIPLPSCEGLSAVLPPAEVFNQSPDSRGHRASYPLAQGPRNLIADFPQCFLGHNTRSHSTLSSPPLCRREHVTCPSGKERGAALACEETEKQVGQEGVAELSGQLRGGGGGTGQEENTDLFSLVGLFPEFDF